MVEPNTINNKIQRFSSLKIKLIPAVVAHAFNPSTQGA